MSINWKHTAFLLLLTIPLTMALDFFGADGLVRYGIAFVSGVAFTIKFPVLK